MLHFFQLQNSKCSSEPMETLNPEISSAFSLLRIIQYSHTVLEHCQGQSQACDTQK